MNRPSASTLRIIPLLLTIIGLLVIMNGTRPERIGPVGVTVFFAVVYLASYLLVDMFLQSRKQPEGESELARTTNHLIATALLASIPPVLLAFASIGQLQARDAGLVVGIAGLLLLYARKR